MNSRTRLACGVAIGYLLGRTRKMRLALMIAGASGAAGSPRELVARGVKQLASVPEVGKLTTIARGQLVDAAKTAAMTAASSRIDALNERLQGKVADGTGEDDDEPRRSARKGRDDSDEDTSAEEARHSEEPGDEPAEDSEEPAEDSAEESDDEPRPRRRAGTARRRAGSDDSADKPRRGSTRRSSRSPVRRAGK